MMGADPGSLGSNVLTPSSPLSASSLPALAARILAANGLGSLQSLAPLAGGQINAAWLLNGEYVLRIRPAEKSGGAFRTESELYARLRRRLPVPGVLAVDCSRAVVDADYMLARRLPGASLTRAWLGSSPGQRERLAAAFADLLREIHAERFPAAGGFVEGELQPAVSWQNYFAVRFERRLGIVRQFQGADRGLLAAIEAHWRRLADSLAAGGEAGSACLVHRDLHFGNVLVEGDRITGVLDFEAAVAGPPDYELDQLGRFFRYPQLFVEPELAPAATRAGFAAAWPLLRRHYLELFAVPRLADRLALYSLEYDLAALRDCYAGRWEPAALEHVVSRITAALAHRHLPGI
jgi:aminoglycoside phosphotransferase (APT) family kinase protein